MHAIFGEKLCVLFGKRVSLTLFLPKPLRRSPPVVMMRGHNIYKKMEDLFLFRGTPPHQADLNLITFLDEDSVFDFEGF